MAAGDVTPMFSQSLRWLLSKHPGSEPVYLKLVTHDDVKLLRLDFEVDICADLEMALDILTGSV